MGVGRRVLFGKSILIVISSFMLDNHIGRKKVSILGKFKKVKLVVTILIPCISFHLPCLFIHDSYLICNVS